MGASVIRLDKILRVIQAYPYQLIYFPDSAHCEQCNGQPPLTR